jgi:hypothetical protein
MRAFDRRLNKLEYEFGVKNETRRMLLVVNAAAKELALDRDACVRILDEGGFLLPSGCVSVHLCDIPEELSAEETKRFLLDHGADICYPQSQP